MRATGPNAVLPAPAVHGCGKRVMSGATKLWPAATAGGSRADSHHRNVRHPPSHHPGRHALRRPRRACLRRVQCRRSRHHHRPDAEDAGASGERNRALPRHDRQAVRREPHLPAVVRLAALSGIHRRDRRGRRQDRGDRRPQPGAIHAGAEGARHQGHPQMHLGAPFAQGRADRLRRGQRRRLRMRRPSRRGRHPQHDSAAARRRRAEDSVRRLRRHGRCAQARRLARARRRRHEHGHALHRHARRRRCTTTSSRRSSPPPSSTRG